MPLPCCDESKLHAKPQHIIFSFSKGAMLLLVFYAEQSRVINVFHYDYAELSAFTWGYKGSRLCTQILFLNRQTPFLFLNTHISFLSRALSSSPRYTRAKGCRILCWRGSDILAHFIMLFDKNHLIHGGLLLLRLHLSAAAPQILFIGDPEIPKPDPPPSNTSPPATTPPPKPPEFKCTYAADPSGRGGWCPEIGAIGWCYCNDQSTYAITTGDQPCGYTLPPEAGPTTIPTTDCAKPTGTESGPQPSDTGATDKPPKDDDKPTDDSNGGPRIPPPVPVPVGAPPPAIPPVGAPPPANPPIGDGAPVSPDGGEPGNQPDDEGDSDEQDQNEDGENEDGKRIKCSPDICNNGQCDVPDDKPAKTKRYVFGSPSRASDLAKRMLDTTNVDIYPLNLAKQKFNVNILGPIKKRDRNTYFWQSLARRTKPYAASVTSLHGCTTLFVASAKGVFSSHLWEENPNPGFPDLSEGKYEQVAQELKDELSKHKDDLKDGEAFLIVPLDPDTEKNQMLLYGENIVKALEGAIKDASGITAERKTYVPLDGTDDDLGEDRRGAFSFEFDPNYKPDNVPKPKYIGDGLVDGLAAYRIIGEGEVYALRNL